MGRIVLLAGEAVSTNIVYNALAREFDDIEVIIEDPVPRVQLIKRRIKKLGLLTVIGQVLFMMSIERWLRKSGAARIKQIKELFGLDDSKITRPIHHVGSVNLEETRNLLKKLNPQVVVVNGTRILSQETLDSVAAKFINIHVGITPTYRGVHGGYWALVEGHPELAGTTVHFVDKGIDTGTVIKQAICQATPEDSFVTYPILQLAIGVPLLVETVRELMNGSLKLQHSISTLPSHLHSHPTLWSYIVNRILRKVK